MKAIRNNVTSEQESVNVKKHKGITDSIWLKSIFYAVVTVLSCVGLLFITSCIPRELIQDNCERSAQYYIAHELFEAKSGYESDRMVDNYADSILHNIIYQLDTSDPVSSSLRASYYHADRTSVAESFYEAVYGTKESNVNYDRYWHGSMVILRPLFIITDIQGVRLILGGCVAILGLIILILLWKMKQRALAVIYLLGMMVIDAFMLFRCLEYVMPFLVLQTTLLYICASYNRKQKRAMERFGNGQEYMRMMDSGLWVFDSYRPMFLVVGIVTAFVDFLTTETLTFTIPMLFLLVFGNSLYEQGRTASVQEVLHGKQILQKRVIKLTQCGFCWFVGYAGMFLSKWLVSAACFGLDAFMSSVRQAAVRINGAVGATDNTNLSETANLFERVYGAIWHNLASLFSMRGTLFSGRVTVAVWITIAVTVALVYLFRVRKIDWSRYLPWFVLALLPYVRYMALSNHAYLHFFFTYRAQLITVMVILLFIWENVREGIIGLIRKKKS